MSNGTSFSFGSLGAGGMLVSTALPGTSDTDVIALSSPTPETRAVVAELDAPVNSITLVPVDPLAAEISGASLGVSSTYSDEPNRI